MDVEGKAHGVETELAELLGQYTAHPVTYAGGVGSMADIEELRRAGQGKTGRDCWQCTGYFWRKHTV